MTKHPVTVTIATVGTDGLSQLAIEVVTRTVHLFASQEELERTCETEGLAPIYDLDAAMWLENQKSN